MRYALDRLVESLQVAVVVALVIAAFTFGVSKIEHHHPAKPEPACITTADPGQHATIFKETP